ncbi:hypothetical protein BKA70DRAFT_1429193 [Coprinopsis sp. MPI-PUGE-AT-0042]|nr:hypothetical protein BKA70DRAFT_1429193 [Coprinopsis sp. MPI-PUGE-AT-0042]
MLWTDPRLDQRPHSSEKQSQRMQAFKSTQRCRAKGKGVILGIPADGTNGGFAATGKSPPFLNTL